MKKICCFLFCLFLLSTTFCHSSHYGYISYSGLNIGDDIQAIAAESFLPIGSLAINREQIAILSYPTPVYTIINGWYLYPRQHKTWPPAPFIKPLLISIHFTANILPHMSAEGVAYLKKHGPVGARDLYTLAELKKRDIPSYFSGCLTLTLNNDRSRRENVIYAVDIDEECLKHLRTKTKCKIEALTHIMTHQASTDPKQRRAFAESLLEKYKTAKAVITCRLHAAMPCLALNTPVLLLNTQPDQYRFEGLKQLAHNCSKREFLENKIAFDFNNPPPNPKEYLPIRDNLIIKVTEWVTKNLPTK